MRDKVAAENLLRVLETRLELAKVDIKAFFFNAAEIAIFGSRAAGVNRADSDLDVLCISDHKRRFTIPQLDCVWVRTEELSSAHWRGCEIASHVAAYGVWLVGEGLWCTSVEIDERAVLAKKRKILSLVRNASSRWPRFHPVFRVKYATSFRRELQRLKLLQHGTPIPPTPILDAIWRDPSMDKEEVCELVANVAEMLPRYSGWISSVTRLMTEPETVLRDLNGTA